MMKVEGHNAAVPSIVPALEQFSAKRALLATWEILQEVDGTALQYEEPCCVCREEYVDGEELGKLDCGHEFHFNCIKQWLM
ncbi:unnamed protein product [Camellia sinensis]